MRVIKHGRVNRVITCNCGCEFEYNQNDIYRLANGVSVIGHSYCNAYVICPDCGEKIFLQLPSSSCETQCNKGVE